MDKQPLTLLVIGIVVGSLLGFGAGFAVYNSQLADIQLQYITLSSQFQVQKLQIEALQADYNDLKSQNDTLTQNYNELRNANQQLEANYEDVKGFVGVLSNDVMVLNQTLYEYGFLPEAFHRTLSNTEVQSQNVTHQVSVIVNKEPITLAAYGNIFNYITGFFTKITTNANIPYLIPSYDIFDGTRYISTFETGFHETYFRTPTETMRRLEGNAVDLGTLQYAMMKNYQQNIMKGTETIYLGIVDLSVGTQGAAIFIPAVNGQITILDVAGGYATREGTRLVSKLAASELGSYYNYYSANKQTITRFTLYDIETTNNKVTKTIQGSLSEIITFFS